MFRYRLRTLLLLMAAGPVVIYYLAMRRIDSADAVEQLKDRQTRRTLEERRIEMERWIRITRTVPLTEEQLFIQWNRLLTDDSGGQIRDAWGRPLTVGWYGFNNDFLYAKSNGINGVADGLGNIGDDIEVHFWLPAFGLHRPASPENDEPRQ